jgi:hypothetical protein
MKGPLLLIVFSFLFRYTVISQVSSKETIPGEEPLVQLLNTTDGYVALTRNSTGDLRIVKLDTALNVSWARDYSYVINVQPVFLKHGLNSELVFGGYNFTSSILLCIDSSGGIINQYVFTDSIWVNDAVKNSNGSYFLQISKSFDHPSFGQIYETGVALMDSSGMISWSHLTQNITWSNTPVEMIAADTNAVFSISEQMGLDYSYMNIVKENMSGPNIHLHGFQTLYNNEYHICKLADAGYLANLFTGDFTPPPFYNFLIKLNPAGLYVNSRSIQFQDTSLNNVAINSMKCIESKDSCWICGGITQGRLHWFKITPGYNMQWSYGIDDISDRLNSIVNSPDGGFVMLTTKPNGLNELIKCDSAGISSCGQFAVQYTISNNNLNDITHPSSRNINVLDSTISCANSNSSYILNNICLLNSLIQDDNSKSRVLFPNPAQKNISISNNHINSYEIINFSGLKMQSGFINSDNEIPIENLKNGIYLLRLENGFTLRFIKDDMSR